MSKMIRIQEEEVAIKNGRDWKGNVACTDKPATCSEEESMALSKRRLEIRN